MRKPEDTLLTPYEVLEDEVRYWRKLCGKLIIEKNELKARLGEKPAQLEFIFK